MGAIMVLMYLAVIVFEIAAAWKVYTKASQPGWAALIPIYNTYVLCKIAGRPGWWVLLFFVPFVNIVVAILVWNTISRSFGHGGGFTAGVILLPFIFIPILGFGSSEFAGAVSARGTATGQLPSLQGR